MSSSPEVDDRSRSRSRSPSPDRRRSLGRESPDPPSSREGSPARGRAQSQDSQMDDRPERGEIPRNRDDPKAEARNAPSSTHSNNDEDDTRAVFIGNFDIDTRGIDLQRAFEDQGAKVKRVDMKKGYAFVYAHRTDNLEGVVEKLNGSQTFSKNLRVEFAKGDGPVRRREQERRRGEMQPNKTLFVVNFDPRRTDERDLRELYRSYGSLQRCEVTRNFAFIEFNDLEDSIRAQKETNNSLLKGDTITVEFASKQLSSKSDRGRRRSSRSRSPPRRREPSGRGRSRERAGRNPPPSSYRRSRSRDRGYGSRADMDRDYRDRYDYGGSQRSGAKDYRDGRDRDSRDPYYEAPRDRERERERRYDDYPPPRSSHRDDYYERSYRDRHPEEDAGYRDRPRERSSRY